MPWKVEKPMDQKINLVSYWCEKQMTVTELSSRFSVSRKTVYKWINRYKTEGASGLYDRKRAPGKHPNETKPALIEKIVEEKRKHICWGPKKIIKRLEMIYPETSWPAPSTAGEWLLKHGLVTIRKRKKRVQPQSEPFLACKSPNDIWSVDYKGQFRTSDRKVCYPLTITDNYSRYLLACDGLQGPRYKETKEVMIRVFKEYGLPLAIRSDNGTPFAGTGAGGLSCLSIWWIKLGIRPERIALGKPQQNGRHERMHKTLKEAVVTPGASNAYDQQEKFDRFRYEYNVERPHEALLMQTPGSVYSRSERQYYKQDQSDINYAPPYETRRIKKGMIKFKGEKFYISNLLHKELLGLKEVRDGIWQLFFSFYPLGFINLHNMKFERELRKV